VRRRLVFRAAPLAILVAALVTGGDRIAETAAPYAKRQPSASIESRALVAYAKLPLSFTPNAGQLDRRASIDLPSSVHGLASL
jgi:hypothetical protein